MRDSRKLRPPLECYKMRRANMESSIIPQQIIENKNIFIRGKKVMLDRDLAILYDVETRALNQAVRRNTKTFP